MPAEKRENHDREATGKIRVAARGAAARVDGPERASPGIYYLARPAARPSPRTAVRLHRPLEDRGNPGRKSSSGDLPAAFEPVPIWLAALLASPCEATGNGENHAVRWNCASGRALYTNARAHAVRIEPLGVNLEKGHTLAVCWAPGETTYSLEVFHQYDHRA